MRIALSLLLSPAVSCFAQVSDTPSPNRILANTRLLFNVTAHFGANSQLEGMSKAGPATGGRLNREYDDGYVRLDTDGNAGGLTWNWGYRDASQISGNDSLVLHSAIGTGTPSASVGLDAPAPGFEIAWLRDIRRTERWAAGLKLACDYSALSFRDDSQAYFASSTITDTYSLGGIVPPGDPTSAGWQYQGVSDSPGPLLPDQPVRREIITEENGQGLSSSRQLDSDLLGTKLGPWVEARLCSRCDLQVGGGLVLAWIDAEYNYTELSTGGSPSPRTASGNASDFLAGGYAEATLVTHLTKKVDFLIGGEFQALQSFEKQISAQDIRLDFGATWLIQAGFSISF